MKRSRWYPSPKHEPGRFFWLHLVLFHVLLLLLWEAGGKEKFQSAVGGNPDPLDRAFYGRIAEGMRVGLLLSMIAWTGLYAALHNIVLKLNTVPLRTGTVVTVILTASAVLQLLAIACFPAEPFSDSVLYVEHAVRLLETGSYLTADGNPTAFWPVGYPAVLALGDLTIGNMTTAARFLNVLSNLLTAFLTWRMFRDELGEKGGLLLLAAMALLPSVLFSAVPLMTESMALALLMAALVLLLKREESCYAGIAAGMCFAAAAYLRPVTLLLAAAILLVLLFRGQRKRQPVLALVMLVIAMAPWTVRNAMHFDGFVPVSTSGGYNFLMGNHHGSSGGINFDFSYDHDADNEAEASHEAYVQGWKAIGDSPLAALLRLPKKLLHSYKRGDASLIWTLKPGGGSALPPWLLSTLFILANVSFYMIVLLSLIAIALGHRRVSSSLLMAVALALAVAVYISIFLYVGSERYMLPLLPIHAFLAIRFFRLDRSPGETAADTSARDGMLHSIDV